MPIPADEILPPTAPAAAGSSAAGAVEEPTVEDIAEQFRELGRRAKEEEPAGDEDEDDDDEEDSAEGQGGSGVAGEGGADGQGGEGGKKKKKKKKKSKAGKAVERLKAVAGGNAPQELVDQIREHMDPSEQSATDEDIQRALKAANLMKLLDGQAALGNKSNTKALGEHKFWKTQPVPQLPMASSSSSSRSQEVEVHEGPIDPPKTPADVKQEPGALPSGFTWSVVDIKNEEQCKEVYQLLSENYVEDDDASFRFRYSQEFLLWALTAPGYLPDWHLGVRVVKTGKLVAFISGIKVEIRVRANTFDSAEINFLCVHKKLRSKRLAPVLIKEVTRRVNLTNVWQAIYTAGVVLPTPISTCRYYHRNLNPPKLIDIGFAALPRNSTMSRTIKQYAVPAQPRTPGWREMVEADVPQVGDLLRRFLARFDIAQTFGKDEEVMHWFISGQGRTEGDKRVQQVVWAYVVEDPSTHAITDVIAFYSLPSSIMKHPKHDVLHAAYLFYYATDAVFQPSSSSGGDATSLAPQTKQALAERLNALVIDLMVVAKQAGFDVLNALTLMDNNLFLDEQKFGQGDGFLNYYLYNWNCAPVNGGLQGTRSKESSGIGVVML